MAKSFIDVVQDSPRTGLGIPVKTKKPPLSNQYTARGYPKIFCLNQTNFLSFKQNISLHQRKCFKHIIFLIQSNIFSECT